MLLKSPPWTRTSPSGTWMFVCLVCVSEMQTNRTTSSLQLLANAAILLRRRPDKANTDKLFTALPMSINRGRMPTNLGDLRGFDAVDSGGLVRSVGAFPCSRPDTILHDSWQKGSQNECSTGILTIRLLTIRHHAYSIHCGMLQATPGKPFQHSGHLQNPGSSAWHHQLSW